MKPKAGQLTNAVAFGPVPKGGSRNSERDALMRAPASLFIALALFACQAWIGRRGPTG